MYVVYMYVYIVEAKRPSSTGGGPEHDATVLPTTAMSSNQCGLGILFAVLGVSCECECDAMSLQPLHCLHNDAMSRGTQVWGILFAVLGCFAGLGFFTKYTGT